MKLNKKRFAYMPPAEKAFKDDPFYNKSAWRNLSKRFRHENPICVYCEVVTSSKITDHLRPRRLWPELEWEWDNFRACCYKCHQKKSSLESKIHNQKEWEKKMTFYLNKDI